MSKVLLGVFSVMPMMLGTGVALALGTLAGCAALTLSLMHLPAWMWAPPISLVSVRDPERGLFAVGLCVSAALLALGGCMHHLLLRALLARDPRAPRANAARYANVVCAAFLLVACLGAALQALVPMQADIVDAMHGLEPVTRDTRLHQAGGALFWMALAVHTALLLLLQARAQPLALLRAPGAARAALRARGALFALALVAQLGAFLATPTLPAPLETVESAFHATALLGWVGVVALLLAVGTYAVDARVVLEHLGIRVFLCGTRAYRPLPSEDEAEASEESAARH